MTKNYVRGTTVGAGQRWALGGYIAGALLLTAMLASLFFSPSAEASSTEMQESLSSHGVTVDGETAERVKRACNYSGSVTTVDLIGTFEGKPQLLAAQCANEGVSAVVVKYGNKS